MSQHQRAVEKEHARLTAAAAELNRHLNTFFDAWDDWKKAPADEHLYRKVQAAGDTFIDAIESILLPETVHYNEQHRRSYKRGFNRQATKSKAEGYKGVVRFVEDCLTMMFKYWFQWVQSEFTDAESYRKTLFIRNYIIDYLKDVTPLWIEPAPKKGKNITNYFRAASANKAKANNNATRRQKRRRENNETNNNNGNIPPGQW